eukprot:SAG31_NODE_412_length_15972_cov_3.590626_9_plen_90_part_00
MTEYSLQWHHDDGEGSAPRARQAIRLAPIQVAIGIGHHMHAAAHARAARTCTCTSTRCMLRGRGSVIASCIRRYIMFHNVSGIQLLLYM